MLQVLNKIIALILAAIVFFSTLSFTVEKHVCMGEITDVSYFLKADSCGMQEDECPIESPTESKIQKEKCCNDVHELIPGHQNEQQALQKLELNQVEFILAFTYTYINLFETSSENIAYVDYIPPLVKNDIQILHQTFLI